MTNKRQMTNKEILKKLEYYVEQYPDMRFCQLLYMLNVIDGSDKFYEESNTTLANLMWKPNKLNTENNGFTK